MTRLHLSCESCLLCTVVKQMFIDKIITKDTEGVIEFLIEMSLGV